MLASAATRDTAEFFQSLTYLWAQLKNDHLKESQLPKLRTALKVVTQEYAIGKNFDRHKDIHELVISVLSNLQFGFDITTLIHTDNQFTIELSVAQELPKDRFSELANSLFDTIGSQCSKKETWKMTYTPKMLTNPFCHELSFVRHR